MKRIALVFVIVLNMPIFAQADSVYKWQLTPSEVRAVKAHIEIVLDSWSPDMLSDGGGSGSILLSAYEGDSLIVRKTLVEYKSKTYMLANDLAHLEVYKDVNGEIFKKELTFFLSIPAIPGLNFVVLVCTIDKIGNFVSHELRISKTSPSKRLYDVFNLDSGVSKNNTDVLWQRFLLSDGFAILQEKVQQAAKASI